MVKSAISISFSYFLRYGLQLLGFLLVAKILGPYTFGIFSAILALSMLLGPIAEWGGYTLILRESKEGIPVSESLNAAIFVTTLMSVGLVVAGLLVRAALFPALPLWPLLLVLITELLGSRMNMLATAAFSAVSKFRMISFFQVLIGALRLTMASLLYVFHGGLLAWSVLYCVSGIGLGLLALYVVYQTCGLGVISYARMKKQVRTGGWFVLSIASQSLYMQADKLCLAFFSTPEIVGYYAIATRCLAVAYMPLNAILTVYAPKFFRLGQRHLRWAKKLGQKVLILTLGYALIASLLLYAGSFFLPMILGDPYALSAYILRYLIIVLIIQAVYYPMIDALNGGYREKTRTSLQLIAMAVNIGINLLLIPFFSWHGAVVALVLSQSILCLSWAVGRR